MAIRDIFKFSRKTFFNPSGWIDLEALISQNKLLWDIFKNMFAKPTKAEEGESFDAAMQRYGLNENDLKDGIGTYRALALVFVLLGAAAIFYTFVLLFKHHTWAGGLLGLVVAALFFAQAFRYDFWALQMRHRKLGLNFADWKRSYLGD